MSRRIPLTILCLWLAGCGSSRQQDPVIGEAFVGPTTLQVREELTARAELAATVKHGDRLEIIGRRRRFLKVRTKSGEEGWVDGRQLLSTGNMNELRRLGERAAKAPSQGRATVFETLNVHTAPNRQSPSFLHITPAQQVDVIAHERAARMPFDPPDLIEAGPMDQPAKKARRKKSEPAVPPPPAGRPPGVPDDWLEVSGWPGGVAPTPEKAAAKDGPPGPSPSTAPMDEWTLVRAPGGRAGWVLSRMLLMAIPDEVAQYAERARISAYFSIGSVKDRGETKPIWLWATLSRGGVKWHFDSLRVFVWSSRRHRYETSFIERGLKGYLPLLLEDPGSGAASGFRVVVEEKNGSLAERSYVFTNYRARVVSRRDAAAPEPWQETAAPGPETRPGSGSPAKEAWQEKAKGYLEGLKDKLKR
ncbi:MAG: SH3 domain-containing protein [Candidatus Solibacter usitatus]|nr:SH3 domain-containing protein [Candidatus Solibacter usitatus]